jgi:hypothetical protein
LLLSSLSHVLASQDRGFFWASRSEQYLRLATKFIHLQSIGILLIDLVMTQLMDLFRIGLIIALVVTMQRTSAVTGRIIPLVLGVVFVAVMLPTTMPSSTVSLKDAILAGLVSNVIILLPVLAAAWLIARWRK